MDEIVRDIVAEQGKLAVPMASVADSQDLYSVGLTSHATVNVMLAIEDRFAIEFPDEMMTKSTFATMNSIVEAVRSLAFAT